MENAILVVIYLIIEMNVNDKETRTKMEKKNYCKITTKNTTNLFIAFICDILIKWEAFFSSILQLFNVLCFLNKSIPRSLFTNTFAFCTICLYTNCDYILNHNCVLHTRKWKQQVINVDWERQSPNYTTSLPGKCMPLFRWCSGWSCSICSFKISNSRMPDAVTSYLCVISDR